MSDRGNHYWWCIWDAWAERETPPPEKMMNEPVYRDNRYWWNLWFRDDPQETPQPRPDSATDETEQTEIQSEDQG